MVAFLEIQAVFSEHRVAPEREAIFHSAVMGALAIALVADAPNSFL